MLGLDQANEQTNASCVHKIEEPKLQVPIVLISFVSLLELISLYFWPSVSTLVYGLDSFLYVFDRI